MSLNKLMTLLFSNRYNKQLLALTAFAGTQTGRRLRHYRLPVCAPYLEVRCSRRCWMGPDYSNYSKAELEEALSSIDKERYPKRLGVILYELQKRNELEPDCYICLWYLCINKWCCSVQRQCLRKRNRPTFLLSLCWLCVRSWCLLFQLRYKR